jgi:hypothetical protein
MFLHINPNETKRVAHHSYGAPLGRVQGVGYVNELLARLTQAPVNDSTQTNTTLTANPATFPLDRTLYADFSHDNEMAAIYAAMGLLPQAAALDPTHPVADVGCQSYRAVRRAHGC